MPALTVRAAVDRFALVGHPLTEEHLNRPWVWRAHDEEGVRFAFFITYHELRQLAARLAAARSERGPALTVAQRALGQHHLAFCDLEAILLGLDEAAFAQPPAPDEWPVRETLRHIVGAEAAFFARIQYALERVRTGDGRPIEMPDELLPRYHGLDEATRARLKTAPQSESWAWYAGLHERVLQTLSGCRDDELQAPSQWWEGYEVPAEFRLHRFDAHLRQHAVQIEKTLRALGRGPGEARMLLRHIYAALAEVEAACFGAWDFGQAEREAAAQEIAARADDIAKVVR